MGVLDPSLATRTEGRTVHVRYIAIAKMHSRRTVIGVGRHKLRYFTMLVGLNGRFYNRSLFEW